MSAAEVKREGVKARVEIFPSTLMAKFATMNGRCVSGIFLNCLLQIADLGLHGFQTHTRWTVKEVDRTAD